MQLEESVTLFDDNKVENRFAELQITADGITSEVSKKVGNDEIISRINQSAEAVTINANKVNIEGAAIFSSGRLSQSSLDGAYDASGSATGAVNDLKSDLSSSSGTTVINGGHIATGTLSAGAVNANSGTFNTANIPNLSASKINSGTISVGVLPSDALNSTYITDIDSNNGIKVHAKNNVNANYAQINSSGMKVYKGGVQVASYGDTSRIGKDGQTHIDVTSTDLNVYSNNGSKIVVSLGEYTNGSGRLDIAGITNGSGARVTPGLFELYGPDDDDCVELVSQVLRWGSNIGGHDYVQFYALPAVPSLYLSSNKSNFIFYVDGTINSSSDRKKKTVLGDIDFAEDFIMGLEPVKFNWKDDTSEKLRLGFVAQDVDALEKQLGVDLAVASAKYKHEYGGYEYKGEDVDDETLDWFLSYDEIIAPLVKVVQTQQKEIDELKSLVKKLAAESEE